ncbi:MAG TPA: hypothetical protein VNE39_16055 [Planctomycetota bacterium]|nr:hypothetical protein [Planctomycetota bacterium]
MAREFGNWRPAEQPAAKAAVVGGRPPGPGKPLGSVPHGIEVLLIEASVDPRFRELLLEKRAEASKAIGVTLSAIEAGLLNDIPASHLTQVIAQTRVSKRLRSEARRKAAKVALAALGTAALAHGCREYVKHLDEQDRAALMRQVGAATIAGIMLRQELHDLRDLEEEDAVPPEGVPGEVGSAGQGEREPRELKNGEQ